MADLHSPIQRAKLLEQSYFGFQNLISVVLAVDENMTLVIVGKKREEMAASVETFDMFPRTGVVLPLLLWRLNKSHYWPRGANRHVDTAENEKA